MCGQRLDCEAVDVSETADAPQESTEYRRAKERAALGRRCLAIAGTFLLESTYNEDLEKLCELRKIRNAQSVKDS